MAFKLKNGKTPIRKVSMEDGVLGKANRDGTIDINKKVKDPKQVDDIIAHESIHIDQMERGDLDYDDTNVYWKGKKFSRSDMKEGAKNLPWEKEAYNKTENKTKQPLQMNEQFKLNGYRGQSEPMSALSKRGLIKEKTMKVRIKPSKEGELSDYARDHVTKTNRKGKVTIKVPKSEMWDEKSKLFNNDIGSFTDAKGKTKIKSLDPAGQSTAKGFKKARRRDRAAVIGASVLGAAMVGSTIGGAIGDFKKQR